MYKLLLIAIFIQSVSCTDQGDPILYSIENTSNFNIQIILFDKLENEDTVLINRNEFKILDQDVPPYDNGPYADKDSIKILFEDLKVLTYRAFSSKDECLNSDKNPFCQYSHYVCMNNTCTFEIDNLEYQKAN